HPWPGKFQSAAQGRYGLFSALPRFVAREMEKNRDRAGRGALARPKFQVARRGFLFPHDSSYGGSDCAAASMNGLLRNEELRRRASSLMELYEPICERVCFFNRASRRAGTQESQSSYQL